MELNEILKLGRKCIKCGFCKQGCPMYMNYREDKWSARGIWVLLEYSRKENNNQIFSSWLFKEILYACTLCGNCLERCPARINTPNAILSLRKLLFR